MDVELRHLRAFAAVAEHRSFTIASRQLLITQPALTRTIQQLEASLGVRLLERTSRFVDLTGPGRTYLSRVHTILRELDVATAEIRGERDLRIGFSWVLPDPWARETIRSFEETTGARAHLVRHDATDDAFDHGDIDVALIRHELTRSDAAVVTLFEEPRVAAVSADSPLAGRDHIGWDELASFPVVINTRSGSTRPELWPPGKRPTQLVECGNYDEWITLIAAGRGVGSTPLSATSTYRHVGVVFVPLRDAPPAPLYLVWLPRTAGPLTRRFAEVAAATAASRDTQRGRAR